MYCIADMSVMGLGVCRRFTTSGSCSTCLWRFWQSLDWATAHSVHSTLLLPSLVRFFLHPPSFTPLLQHHVKTPNYQKHENGWTWTWNMQNTGALNKGRAEKWLNVSAGRKKGPLKINVIMKALRGGLSGLGSDRRQEEEGGMLPALWSTNRNPFS